jgi:hypothetical protein
MEHLRAAQKRNNKFRGMDAACRRPTPTPPPPPLTRDRSRNSFFLELYRDLYRALRDVSVIYFITVLTLTRNL